MPTNAEALSRLLLADRAPLMRWVARIVGAGPAAEDVTQSLWLRVQRVADDPPITHKRAYLYRLASNLALDHGKREARLQSVHEEAQALLWGSDHALAADRTILARDTLKRIKTGINALPSQTRRVFELHRYDHLTQREVAERLGISTTAVEKHMRRAMTVIAACRDADD